MVNSKFNMTFEKFHEFTKKSALKSSYMVNLKLRWHLRIFFELTFDNFFLTTCVANTVSQKSGVLTFENLFWAAVWPFLSDHVCDYGVATISRLLKIIGLFCKRALQKIPIFSKDTYNLKEPTNHSHPHIKELSKSGL